MNCELCKLVAGNTKTRFYYKDKFCTIVDCLTCGEGYPLVVFRRHGEASEYERTFVMTDISYLFEYESVRKKPRKILDHEHWHIEGAKYLDR